MPTRNALASVSLSSEQITPRGPFHVALMVWSRSYDHPDPGHRNAMIKEVHLTQLTGGTHSVSNLLITDRYGIDETELWKRGGADLRRDSSSTLNGFHPQDVRKAFPLRGTRTPAPMS